MIHNHNHIPDIFQIFTDTNFYVSLCNEPIYSPSTPHGCQGIICYPSNFNQFHSMHDKNPSSLIDLGC